METIKEAVSEVNEIRKAVFDCKTLKNSIKKSIVENLNEIIRFLTVGPGVVSPESVRTRCNRTIDLIRVWWKVPNFSSSVEKLLEVKRRFISIYLSTSSTPVSSSEDANEEDKKLPALEKEVLERNKELESKISAVFKEKFIPLYIERLKPEKIERGDVSFLPIGPIMHYCIVFKVVGDISFVISITSNEDDFVGYTIEKSRFFKGKAVYALHQIPTALVIRKFAMPYDNKSELKKILSGCEDYLKTNILKRTYTKRTKK